ncbi:MAG: DUF3784 domain-containing protein [Oscillospiraceae bacterium]|jgi:hypothetical protein|nr:DUF3784 domain-containing protein [Oscillospiraceae bacterium]
MNAVLFVIFGVVLAPMIIIAICLLNSKGAFLIAGYNTMSKAEKAMYDEKALCRSVGWLLIGISFCMLLVPTGIYFKISWLSYGGIALAFLGAVGYIIYANTGNRFRAKQISETPVADENNMPKLNTVKATIIAAIVIAVAAFTALGILFYQGDKDPVVNILNNSIEINAMYGLSIDFTDIMAISIIEESMSDIGTGRKTNGYDGFGGALKGHFKSNNLGETLLFVQSKTAPTIRVERDGMKDIYISFRNAETTRELYEKMAGAFSSR